MSTSTSDEGGFNDPLPEIKARLIPHEDSLYEEPFGEISQRDVPKKTEEKYEDHVDFTNETNSFVYPRQLSAQEIEALYAVPHKPHLNQQKSADSESSQQKSSDSDVIYRSDNVITNSVLADLERRESYEKACQEYYDKENPSHYNCSADAYYENTNCSVICEVCI